MPTEPKQIGRRLGVEYRPLSALKLDPRNPRVHSPHQIRQIARSIEAFGFNVPVLVDSELKLIAGHGRVLAAKQLGLAELPTISLDRLSEAQARAFLIADNKLTDNSVWDDQLLAQQLHELSLLDLDFSIEATGFEMGEIDLRIEGACRSRGLLILTSEVIVAESPPYLLHGFARLASGMQQLPRWSRKKGSSKRSDLTTGPSTSTR